MYSKKDILRVAYPIFLSFLAQNIVNVTDTAFLGRVGEVELGASALAGVFYMSLFMIGLGFSVGVQILIGRRNGEGNQAKIGEIFFHGMLFLLLMALLIAGLVYLFSAPLLQRAIQSNEVYEATIAFLDIRILGLFFIFPNSLFRSFYIGITHTRVLMVNAFIMAGVNVLLDYLLIFGHWGLPQMGIAGAALASVIAEACALLFICAYTFWGIDRKMYSLSLATKPEFRVIRHILSVSAYTMLQSFLSISTWFIFFMGIEHLGERALAVSNVVRSLYLMLLLPVLALSITASTLVSNLIGSGEKGLVLSLIWRIVRMVLLFLLPMVLLVGLFSDFFIRIYTDDSGLVADCVIPLWVLLSSMLPAALGSVFFHALGGTGNTRVSLYVELICLVLYVSYMWWMIWVRESSVALCWTTEHVYWIIIFIFSYLYIKSGKWMKREI